MKKWTFILWLMGYVLSTHPVPRAAAADAVRGRVQTRWRVPVRVTAAWPGGGGARLATVTLTPGEEEFRVPRPAD